MTVLLEKVFEALQHSWRADTAYDASGWSEGNPARGQCVVSSLVINDYFKGDFQKYKVHGAVEETHYCNILPDGAYIDSTGKQYDGLIVSLHPIKYNLASFSTCREKLLSDIATNERYEILKSRVSDYLNKS